jgi:hypothetical protein
VKPPGKKVGKLVVALFRKESSCRDSVDLELRLDVSTGTFHAAWEGQWYGAKTHDDLADQIRRVVAEEPDVTWTRYLVIDYEARSWALEGDSGRPELSRCETLSLDDDRTAMTRDHEDGPRAVASIRLHWQLYEISSPYPKPGDKRRTVRMFRDVRCELNPDEGGRGAYREVVGHAEEQDDDRIPPGAVPWTAEREAILRDVLAGIGRLDARLVALFRGDPAQLAGRLDATTASRLLPPQDDVLTLAASSEPRPAEDILWKSIDRTLDLSVRSENLLLANQIVTLGDLVQRSKDDLLHLRHANRKAVTEIAGELAKLGLSLRASEP